MTQPTTSITFRNSLKTAPRPPRFLSRLFQRDSVVLPVKSVVASIIDRIPLDGARRLAGRAFGLKAFYITSKSHHSETIELPGISDSLMSGKIVDQRVAVHDHVDRSQRLTAQTIQPALLSLNRRGGFALSGRHLYSRSPIGNQTPKIVFPQVPVAGEVYQTKDRVYLSVPRAESSIPTGIYVGSLAPHNWFHWLIDTLPVVHGLAQLPTEFVDYPVLLPTKALETQARREALDTVLHGRQALTLSDEGFHRVGKLLMVNGMTTAFPRSLGPLSESVRNNGRIYINQSALRGFRARVLSQLGLSEARQQAGFRIFLGRKEGSARSYNQAELIEVSSRYGFDVVYLEDLSFRESVRLFTQAETIIGPHGAGFANSVFAGTGARVLYWSWADQRGDNWYESLFAATGINARFLPVVFAGTGSSGEDPRSASYYVSPNKFRDQLAKLLLDADQ